MTAYVMGEQVQLGVGIEDTRGTPVAPQAWIPARTPAGIVTVLEKAQIRESRGTGIAGQGSEIVQSRAEGDLEFNVRSSTFGYLLLSLLGSVSSSYALGAGTHTFTRQSSGPQNPALTLALAQPNVQHYEYPLAVVNSLEINIPIDDVVNATANFIAKKENEHANYTPAFVADSEDALFRNHDVTIKIADSVDDLGAAVGICVKEFSLSINNNARPKMCVGQQFPTDILSIASELTGSFSTDLEDVADFYDVFKDGAYKAVRIEMERDDLPALGSSAIYHKITITLPRVSFDNYTPERSLEDIVGETIEFSAHYDETEESAIEVVLQNETESYEAVSGS